MMKFKEEAAVALPKGTEIYQGNGFLYTLYRKNLVYIAASAEAAVLSNNLKDLAIFEKTTERGELLILAPKGQRRVVHTIS